MNTINEKEFETMLNNITPDTTKVSADITKVSADSDFGIAFAALDRAINAVARAKRELSAAAAKLNDNPLYAGTTDAIDDYISELSDTEDSAIKAIGLLIVSHASEVD